MIIYLKNKKTLQVDNFSFKCSVGRNGLTLFKKEGDNKTPKGTFSIENLYYREDKVEIQNIKIKKIKINKHMGWCDDSSDIKKYNKLIKINSRRKVSYEKLFRHDNKYDLLIPIKYNFNNPVLQKGSCIFLHLTKNYNPTAGCIALKKKDFLIMLKLIDKKTKIKIS